MATLTLALLGACGGGLTAAGSVVRPAAMPLRAFPHILIVSDTSDAATHVAGRLAAHLEGSRSRVQTGHPDEVAGLRSRGVLSPGTVVVAIEAELVEDERVSWGRRDPLDCGPLGCPDAQRPVVQTSQVVIGRVRLTVTDGPSGRPLQREDLHEEEAGADVLGMRLRVLERLGERTTAMVDQRTEPVVVELLAVDAPAVRRALALVDRGDWARGADVLEAFVESPAMAALTPDDRARVLYDLGQARRFDSTLPPDERHARAGELLRAAIRLAPEARYAAALAELEADRRSRALVRAQAEAQTHNFRLADGGAPVPEPPASYR